MIVLCNEEELQKDWPNLITMEEKGYPIRNARFYVKYIKNQPVGHICYKDMGNWYFIGNSYVKSKFRNQGIYDELMRKRNDDLRDKPKIAILIPIEDSELNRLEERISKRGYEKISTYFNAYKIISFLDYIKFRKYNLWKLER
jgi:predicted GNAT family acetyltransferase